MNKSKYVITTVVAVIMIVFVFFGTMTIRDSYSSRQSNETNRAKIAVCANMPVDKRISCLSVVYPKPPVLTQRDKDMKECKSIHNSGGYSDSKRQTECMIAVINKGK